MPSVAEASIAASLLITFILTLASARLVKSYMERIGKTGIDVHKPAELRRPVAEMGGIALLFGVSAGFTLLLLTGAIDFRWLVALSSGLLAGLVGLIDDLKDLGDKLKPALTMVAFLPIYLCGCYNPRPALPFLPRTRITILYTLLLPFSIAVPANAVNMLDVVNGATPITTIPVFLAMAIIALIQGRDAWMPSIILVASLIAILHYNRYPARLFLGNVGDLFVGGMLGAIAVVGGVEIVAIVGMMPHIMNGFSSLSSVRGLFTRTSIPRPTVIDDRGLIWDSGEGRAPLTLVRLMVSDGPRTEPEVIRVLAILSTSSFILALITGLLTGVRL